MNDQSDDVKLAKLRGSIERKILTLHLATQTGDPRTH